MRKTRAEVKALSRMSKGTAYESETFASEREDVHGHGIPRGDPPSRGLPEGRGDH